MEQGVREPIIKLGKKLTDRADIKLGLTKMTENEPEYVGLSTVVTDEMAEIALKMDIRKDYLTSDVAKLIGRDEAYTEDMLWKMAKVGLLEFNYQGPDGARQWVLPRFVPGVAEYVNMHIEQAEAHPELGMMFDRMGFLPLKKITPMVPPGGAGIGMHTIPVESAIPADSQSVSLEHISHWLDKYDGLYAASTCSCRTIHRIMGDAAGEMEEDCCIGVGDMARYLVDTGIGHYISREEVLTILKRAEENGYVHQITNIDGEDKIIGICNCDLAVCVALRTSQLFNTPNMSASAYRAHVDSEKCVACGKCAEVCPAGAAKLGQKLCAKSGKVEYPVQPLPDNTPWGEHMWNHDYTNTNRRNCHESGTSPCKAACPAHIAVQGYIKMAAEGRYLDALKLIKQDNPFPAVCGSICNRRCEDACTRGAVDGAVAIDEIKKFVAQYELKEENRYIPEKRMHKIGTEPYTEKIAIIGAGPAGMSCAYWLANMGYANVTVFERNPVPGGMLTAGIPSFRLERNIIEAEIDVLRQMGVEFKCGVEVGKDVTIEQLRGEGYKGFYLAIGAQKSAALGIPGEELSGVYGAVDFLRAVNLGDRPETGAKCAVIGGGNVAIDAARTAVRLGADVTVVYRRKESDMRADPEEIAEAKAEGVKFLFEHKPLEIKGADGKAKALVCDCGEVEADCIIAAIGQRVDWGKLDVGALKIGEKALAEADAVTYQTAQPDIFVGGDVYTGPKFAIDAIAAGREGAISLHRYVHPGNSLTNSRNPYDYSKLDRTEVVIPTDSFDCPARQKVMHDGSKAKSFSDDRLVFTEEQVRAEASRCLGCGVSVVDVNKCIGCGLCTTRCEFDAIHLRRDHPEATHMIRCEDKLKEILPYAAKRAARIKISQLKEKFAK